MATIVLASVLACCLASGPREGYESMHQDDPRARPWSTPADYEIKIMTDKKFYRDFNHFNVKEEKEKEDDGFAVIDKPTQSSTNGGKKEKTTHKKK